MQSVLKLGLVAALIFWFTSGSAPGNPFHDAFEEAIGKINIVNKLHKISFVLFVVFYGSIIYELYVGVWACGPRLLCIVDCV